MSLGILLALASALAWGSGDYCGGRAATRHGPFEVLWLAATSGLVLLLVAAVVRGERVTLDATFGWALAAGAGGAWGIVALYQGLARGRAAVVAPTAAVVAAAVPVAYTAITAGLPGPQQASGFVLALVGIGLVARAADADRGGARGLGHGALAGLGFGAFLVLIAQGDAAAVFAPLAVARAMMMVTAALALSVARTPRPGWLASPVSLLAGLLDAGGNVLYLLARQHVRLDVAAVLSSLYPVSTLLLTRLLLQEAMTPLQWLGACVCLLAVGLIAA